MSPKKKTPKKKTLETYEVDIARDYSEYATVTVEAESPEAAQAKVEAILATDGDEYCALVNDASWSHGGEAQNERVIDVSYDVDEDEECAPLCASRVAFGECTCGRVDRQAAKDKG